MTAKAKALRKAMLAEVGMEESDFEAGRYLAPGKFEGETVATVLAYGDMMNGCDTWHVTSDVLAAFPEIRDLGFSVGDEYYVHESSDGFASLSTFEPDYSES